MLELKNRLQQAVFFGLPYRIDSEKDPIITAYLQSFGSSQVDNGLVAMTGVAEWSAVGSALRALSATLVDQLNKRDSF